jgi:predicted neuraminidase
VLFRDADNVVYLFFKVGPEIPTWQTYWMRSEDSGKTWSEAVELVAGDAGGRGPVRSKPITMSDGAWIAGASTELGDWLPFSDRSTDKGQTWERSANFAFDKAALPGKGAIQPTVWESAPGKVHALLRTTGGKLWRVDSEDGGRTWSDMYPTELPNNNSGADVLYLPEQERLLLIYNPVSGNWAARTPLDLAESRDNGKTWRTIVHLEDDADLRSEFSYPAIVRTAEGVAMTYTYQRERVRCWQVPMTALD